MTRVSFKKGYRTYAVAIITTNLVLAAWVVYYLFTFFTLPGEESRPFFIWGFVVFLIATLMVMFLYRDISLKKRRDEKRQLKAEKKAAKAASKDMETSDPELAQALNE